MANDKIKKTARKFALQNAIQFNGTANSKAVAGKVIAAFKDKNIPPSEIYQISGSVCSDVNKISIKKQIAELEKLAPELLKKEKKERDFSLPPLPDAEKGKVITRFPPEPNGYLHIGHAKAAIIDHEYARIYEGKFILRFDDTNPENAQLEFYDSQKEDLKWLGLDWDKEYNTSDNLKTHYKLAEQLINQGDAYICQCTSEVIKKNRYQGRPCKCKNKNPGEVLDLWKELFSSEISQGSILRLNGDMKSENTAMRDPTLFRVIKKEHPLQGSKYHVWPTYDFAGAVEDSIGGITHPFRTKEYELRDPVYFHILSRLNLRKPHLMEFARLSIEGMPVSKRKIKPLIDKKLVSGYDDIRLPTLRGLQKRGIVPEAIEQFVFSQGISKVESNVTFGLVESFNRKILDPKVKRYFFVPDPIKLNVKNTTKKTIKLRLHPAADLGERTIETQSNFYVPKEDIQKTKVGDIIRLKDSFNIKITKKAGDISAEYAGEEMILDTPKIQWTTDKYIKLNIYVPGLLFENDQYNPDSLKKINGFAEEEVSKLKSGEIVQFERFGFVRIERQKDSFNGYFSHK